MESFAANHVTTLGSDSIATTERDVPTNDATIQRTRCYRKRVPPPSHTSHTQRHVNNKKSEWNLTKGLFRLPWFWDFLIHGEIFAFTVTCRFQNPLWIKKSTCGFFNPTCACCTSTFNGQSWVFSTLPVQWLVFIGTDWYSWNLRVDFIKSTRGFWISTCGLFAKSHPKIHG